MKPGRNEPCPCGSGIKYKKCVDTHPPTEQDLEEAYRYNDRLNTPRSSKLGAAAVFAIASMLEVR